jgi:hypothetical protein
MAIHPPVPLDTNVIKLENKCIFLTSLRTFSQFIVFSAVFFHTCCMQHKGLVLMSGADVGCNGKSFKILAELRSTKTQTQCLRMPCHLCGFKGSCPHSCSALYTIRLRTCHTQLSSVRWHTLFCWLLTHLVCIVRIPIFVTHCLLKYGATCCEKLYFSFIVYVMQTDTKWRNKKQTLNYIHNSHYGFLVLTSSGLVGEYWRFESTYILSFQGWGA